MIGYKVRRLLLVPISLIALFFSFRVNKNVRNLCILFIVCFCLASSRIAAQSDTTNDLYDDEEKSDSSTTENGFDTTGYYFNWKETPDEAFAKQKFNSRISSDTTIAKFRNEDEFWYVKSVEDFKKNAERLQYDRKYRDSLSKAGALPPDEQDFTVEQPWIYNLTWIVIVSIFIAAIVFFLMSNKISLFARTSTKTHEEDVTTEDDLRSVSYDSLLQKYIAEKNHRLAVRVLYLQILKMLTERSIISYQPHYTNTHYLQQLARTPLYKDFFTVTRHYEYIWYGEFPISDEAFQKVNGDFANMKKEVLRK